MYKVVLADDEMLDLEGMKQFIPWYELQMEVVGAVGNGFSACELMEQSPVDILVTDVHMPNMSGLELARRALEINERIRVIFISGYQDFHYVKQALSLNACSYVLKPMDDQELIDSLTKVKRELDEERRRQEEEETYRQMIPIAKNEFLKRLFEGELNMEQDQTAKKLAASYGLSLLHWPVRAAVLELDDFSLNLQQRTGQESQSGIQSFFAETAQVCSRFGIEHVCKISRHRLALLGQDEVLDPCLDALYTQIQEHYPFTMTVGIGSPISSEDLIPLSYSLALEAVESKMFLGKGCRISYEEVRKGAALADVRTLNPRLEALFRAMSDYELVRIHDEIEKLFYSVSSLRSKFTIHNLAMYIVWKLDQYLQTLDADLFSMLGMELQNLDILLQFETIGDIRSWLVRKVFEISEMLHLKNATKNSRLIREIIKIIKERMHENITLKDIAHHFSFSPNYLGHIFKTEVGRTFSEVLIQMRMERARALLNDPKLKIYEVAAQVGYRYLPYFSRQFKETFGMTPMECRKGL